ncbi:MAG: carboxypeptidase regulatory-like domain-containing protein [Candidatus Eisenbacteria sp.]|nr:carboxypeptidase regulatory-like domain-containing protein [Candidatus Eisenbacteria bacterium]
MRCTLAALAVILLIGPLGSIPPCAGAEEPEFDTGLASDFELIPLRGGSESESAEPTIRIAEETDRGIVLDFELPALRQVAVEAEGGTYQVLTIDDGGFAGAEGAPMVPTYSRLLQIPDRAGVTVTVTHFETTELSDYRLLPMQPGKPGALVRDAGAYAQAGYPQIERVQIGEPAIARNLRVVPITFHPVRHDPLGEKVEVAHRIQVRIDFTGEDLRNVKTFHHATIPPSFDQIYRHTVVNYRGPSRGQTVSLGSYVIICPNNSSVISALSPLVSWRQRKGYEVYLATTSETGSTVASIQSWLRNAYETWPNPPEYVCIVGDANGTVAIPCSHWNGGEGDFPYAMLDGDDALADAHVGRISVTSSTELTYYVNKIVGYESTPYMDDTAWYTRGCVVGDPSHSGYTTIQIGEWLMHQLLDNGYTEVDTVFSVPFVMGINNALNRGDTVFCYRGYYWMSDYTTGDMHALGNGNKMPFGTMITCDTGSFEDDIECRSEAFMRAVGTGGAPKAGIAAVGAATLSTHTRHNNCVTYGIWGAAFKEQTYTFGAMLTRGKYELYLNYSGGDMNGVWEFCYWDNLMGDPGGELWTGVPQAISVDHPDEVALGASSLTINVTAGGFPCEGAYVCLFKEGVIHVGGHTGNDGSVELPVAGVTEGPKQMTVTKHDHHPYLGEVTIGQQSRFVGYASHTIDDDASGTSSGNGDGAANPGERIELPVELENFGTSSVHVVTGALESADPYVTISDAVESFPDLDAGGKGWSTEDFDIEIAGGAPNGHTIRLGLDVSSGGDTWHSMIEIPVVAAAFSYDGATLYDFGTSIDPGEEGELSVRIINDGDATAASLVGTLASDSPWLVVTDPNGSFASVAPGATGENTGNRFGLSAAAECYPGHIVPMTLVFQFSSGALDTVHFALQVGDPGSSDPTGPDAYGYYAFDNTDTGYPEVPTYNWVEIATNHGGPGTSAGLSDHSFEYGDSDVFDLPFTFRFYGQDFDRVTICSNGWIAMGYTPLTNYRNWTIPAIGAPPYLIAPMWDGLYQSGSDQVYYWFDSSGHRFIVQWSRVRNDVNNYIENFEVILYDPAYYPTDTGDGIIVFQYDTFRKGNYTHNFWTTGIENGDQTDGVLYSFYDMYNSGSSTIASGRAIKFIPLATEPLGTLTGTVENATHAGNGVPGAEISLLERSGTLVTQFDGSYTGPVPIGTYTLVVTHPSFTSDTAYAVPIVEGETTVRDFTLTDILGPAFSGTTDYGNTSDSDGPYEIFTTAIEYSVAEELSLIYNPAGAGWVTVPLEHQSGDLYKAEIPGQLQGSLIKYYLHGRDNGGNESFQPSGAPPETYAFWVVPPLVDDDMESGTAGWTHAVASGGFVDDWHHSTERNHTPGGSYSWKFGDSGSATYNSLADGALVTEAFALDGEDATVTFWHWMDAEVSGSWPGYAYDGGMIEIEINGGGWNQITPVGGYTHVVRTGAGPGPYPEETPIISGTFDWTEAQIELEGISGTVQLRFRFGSDGYVEQEGWHIDDIEIVAQSPGASDARELTLRPERVALYQNRPNPFGSLRGQTSIRFDLPRESQVRLAIYDVGGRLVRTLVRESLQTGRYDIEWNGLDAGGRHVESGVYFYILDAGEGQLSRRLLMLR